MLARTAGGFGSLALRNSLLPRTAKPELNGGLHHPAKVKRVIQLFMNGGASQMDTFDYKPELVKRHGEKVDFGLKVGGDQRAGQHHEVAVRVEAARRMGPLGEQRLSAHGRAASTTWRS